jgi:phosphatidylserine decarboxylase
MHSPAPILYRDRRSGAIVTETIFREHTLRWLYETAWGHLVLRLFLNHKLFHMLYGSYQNLPQSRHRIAQFVDRYGIDTSELTLPITDYPSFNAFFTRQLQPAARPFAPNPRVFCAPGDGKVRVYSQLNRHSPFLVKGQSMPLATLLPSSLDTDQYHNGAAMVLRLAPQDYHRFHFPDGGIAQAAESIAGEYHSVHPLALAKVPAVYGRNQRVITQLDTDNFGRMAYVEVGALTVSSIRQTYQPGRVLRGQEKGYFQYGGSTLILLFEPEQIIFDSDLVQDTAQGMETHVLAGSQLGVHPSARNRS